MYKVKMIHNLIGRYKHRGFFTDISAILIGQLFSVLGAFIGLRFITEVVNPSVYGEVKLILGLVTFFSGIFITPAIQYVMRKVHDFDTEDIALFKEKSKNYIILFSLFLGVFLFAGLNAYGLFHKTSYVLSGFAAVMILVFSAGVDMEKSLMISLRKQVVATIVMASRQWVAPLFVVLAIILLGDNVSVYLFAYALSLLLIVVAIKRLYVSKGVSEKPSIKNKFFFKPWLKEALPYTLPLVWVGISNWIVNLGDRYIMLEYLNLKDIGVYSASYGLGSMPMTLIGGMVARFFYPIYFKKAANSKNSTIDKRVITLTMLTIFVLGGIVWLFFAIWGKYFISLVLARQYQEDALVLVLWILGGYLFLTTAWSYDLFTYARKKTKFRAIAFGVSAIVNITLNFYLIPKEGIVGAAKVTCVTFLCYFLIMTGFTLFAIKKKEKYILG